MIYKIRSYFTNLFGWVAALSWLLLILCAFMFSYVGVQIQYVLVPSAVVFTTLWWVIHPDKNIKE